MGYKYVGLFKKGDFRVCLEIPEKTVSFLWCQLNGGLLCEMRWSSWLGNVERQGGGPGVDRARRWPWTGSEASTRPPPPLALQGVQPCGPLKPAFPAVVSKTGDTPTFLWMLVDVRWETWASWWNECGNTGLTKVTERPSRHSCSLMSRCACVL